MNLHIKLNSNSLFIVYLVCILFVGCKKAGFFKEDGSLNQLPQYQVVVPDAGTTILADSQQTILTKYILNKARATDYFTPTFPEIGGKLFGLINSKVFLQKDTGYSYIQVSTVPGTYTLSIMLNDQPSTLKNIAITTLPSLPDTLLVEPDKSIADTTAGSSVNFTIYLRKAVGVVSKERSISATAFQMRGGINIEVGRFSGLVNNKSDDKGKISIQYFTDTKDFDVSKKITLIFSSPTNKNNITATEYVLPIK